MTPTPDADERRRLLALGCEAFEQGAFFEAHERWEDAWRASSGAERAVFHALVQLAVAFHKLDEGRTHVALRFFDKALAKLPMGESPIVGVDVAHLRRDASAARDALAAGKRPTMRIHRV